MTRRRTNPVLFDHLMSKLQRAARRKGAKGHYKQARRECCHIGCILRG